MNTSRSLHEQLYLGVDGGASNITVAISNQRGDIVFQHTSGGGANYHNIGLQAAIENIEEAVQGAIDKLKIPPPVIFDYAVFGLSGCNFPSDQQRLNQAISYSSLSTMVGGGYKVVNDIILGLRAGLPEGVGIALIVGTGSNCLGRNKEGEVAQSGGLDYLLSDEGSGYDIGLRALKSAARELDGRAEASRFSKEILKHLNVSNLEQYHEQVYRKYTDKAAIASLAEVVSDLAIQDDRVAKDILNHAVNDLLKMVDAVMTKFNWRDEPISIVLIGSTINQGRYLRQRFDMEIRRINPRVRLVRLEISPAAAAALLAKDEGTQ